MAQLSGRRVLVVEDEVLVANTLEAVLRHAGCEVLGPISSLDKAVAAARHEEIDVALLDLNLAGNKVYPVAEVLLKREIPFVLMTGNRGEALPSGYEGRPVMFKPFPVESMLDVLRKMLERARSNLS